MPYKKKAPAKKKMSSVPAPVKQYVNRVVNGTEETKYTTFGPLYADNCNNGFTSGNIYTLNPLQSMSTSGTTITSRIGDTVRLMSVTLRGTIRNAENKAANVRVVVTRTREALDTEQGKFKAGLLTSSTLLLDGGASWYAPVDKNRHTVLKDFIFKIPQNNISDQPNDRQIKIRQTFKYPKFTFLRNSFRGTNGDILLHIIPIDANVQYDETMNLTAFFKDS